MKKKAVKILTTLAIILVVLGIIYAIWVGVSTTKLHRAYAALRKDGRPMRVVDVIPPRVPEAENAAPLYESAIFLLKAQPAPEKNLLEYLSDRSFKFTRESLEADQLTEFRKLLQQDVVTQALLTVQQGVERPSCRFDLDYGDGINTILAHLPGLRAFTRILGVRAQFAAEAGRSDEAWDLVLTQLKLSEALRTEPIIVSQLVRSACIRFTCQTIQRLCAIAPPDEQRRTQLEDLLKDLGDVAPLVRAIDGERVVCGETVFTLPKREQREMLATLVDEDNASRIVRRFALWRMSFKPLLLADHAAYLHFMHRHAGLFERPYSSEGMSVLRGLDDKIQRRYLLTGILMPALARIKEIHTQLIAEAHVTRAGLALLQYRDAHGALPKTLDDLAVRVPDDPFAQGPLRYRPETDGFVLYSLGPDQKDNEGRAKEPKQKTDYDIVWCFPSQPVR